MAKTALGLFICLCIDLMFPVDCVLIKFYENGDLTGLFHESNSTRKCNNFLGNTSPFVKSIKTDTCLMIYLDINCKSPYSWKIMPPEISDAEYRLGSFHICNDEGGSQLNLDITEYYDIFNPMESPKVLESYQNVCDCVNVPKYIQLLEEWSINNHGNELLAYYVPDCSDRKWEPKLIPAGHSLDSRKVYMHQITEPRKNHRFGIQSFGPYKYSLYFQHSCNLTRSATKKIMAVNMPQVQLNNQHNFSKQFLNDVNCKTDNHLLKIMEDGFRQQIEAYSSLLKKISELENSVQNLTIFQTNKKEC